MSNGWDSFVRLLTLLYYTIILLGLLKTGQIIMRKGQVYFAAKGGRLPCVTLESPLIYRVRKEKGEEAT